jgi:hypothetical protein
MSDERRTETTPILPRGLADRDYDQGFLDGWEHALSVLAWERRGGLEDTAAVCVKRQKLEACSRLESTT